MSPASLNCRIIAVFGWMPALIILQENKTSFSAFDQFLLPAAARALLRQVSGTNELAVVQIKSPMATMSAHSIAKVHARVRFGKGVSKSPLAAGDRVVLHGRITDLPRECSAKGFSPTITVRYVRITAADADKH